MIGGHLLRLTTLGATDLRDRLGHPIREVLTQPKRLAILIYLAVEGRRGPVPRDRLLGLFWPESDEGRARNALSQALHHLRQALGGDVLESHGAAAVSVRSEALWCDATAFADALERGEVDLALDLYRGEFCSTTFGSGTPELEQWMDGQRTRLRGQAFEAARAMAVGLAERGDHAGAARVARRALALEPDDERDVRTLLAVLDQAGDSTGALLAYKEYERRLATELEAQPAPETRRLAETIRRRRESLALQPEPEAPAPRPAAAGPAPRVDASSPPPAAPRPGLRRPATVIAAAVLALAVLVTAIALGSRSGRDETHTVRRLAVVPFALRAGTHLAFLRDGMVDLVSAKLGDVPELQVIDPRSVIAAAADEDGDKSPRAEFSARVARRLGAGWYISGDVIEVAGRLQLDGALYDVRSGREPLASASVVGDTAALFELVDELTGRILAGMLMGRDTAVTRLAAVTTRSLPALKAFLEGERALRAGQDAQAAAAFRAAVDLDSSFALAQYRLALTATWVTVRGAEDPAVWAASAARHADRLTPLGRDLLTAYRAYKEVRAEDAENRYRAITLAHPDNVEAWLMLGEVWFHYNPIRGRSSREAWPAFQRVLALDPGNLHALLHLARLAAWDGQVAVMDSLARRYQGISPDATRLLEMRGILAYVHDDPAERKAVALAARDADDRVVSSLLQTATLQAQNLPAARELAGTFIQSVSDSIAWLFGRRSLSELDLGGGHWDGSRLRRWLGSAVDEDWLLESQALLATDPILPLSREWVKELRARVAARHPFPALGRVLRANVDVGASFQTYLLGLLDLRLGDTAAASRAAVELVSARDSTHAEAARQLGHALRAELARSRGEPGSALAELDQFKFDSWEPWAMRSAHWGVRERFLRAELLHALGRDEEALATYESFQAPSDFPFIAVTQLRQGQIHQRLGHTERARFHYGRFLSLYHDADPEFGPMVQGARKEWEKLGGR